MLLLQPREHSSWSKASKALSKETLLSIGYIITKYQRNTLALFVGRFLRKTKRITNWHSQRTDTNLKSSLRKIMCWCWNSQSSLVTKIKEQPRRKMYYYYLLIKPKTHQVTSLKKSRWKNLWCTTPRGFGSRALGCMWRLSYYYYYLLPESGLSISLLFLEEIENTRKTYLL